MRERHVYLPDSFKPPDPPDGTIFLHYLLSVDESQAQSGTRVSDTMPDSVFMRWSTEKDAFTVSIYNVETVPTLEWLLSIDLVPYNPNQGNP